MPMHAPPRCPPRIARSCAAGALVRPNRKTELPPSEARTKGAFGGPPGTGRAESPHLRRRGTRRVGRQGGGASEGASRGERQDCRLMLIAGDGAPCPDCLRLRLENIADRNGPSDENTGRHAAMPSRRGIAARSDGLFPARTGLTRPDDLQHGTTHLQPGILQRQEIDARDHEVPTQAHRVHQFDARQARDDVQMLDLSLDPGRLVEVANRFSCEGRHPPGSRVAVGLVQSVRATGRPLLRPA